MTHFQILHCSDVLKVACWCSVPKSCLTLCDPTDWLQHARLACPSLYPTVCLDSYPSSQWCYLTISSSAAPISFCLQSFLALGSFPVFSVNVFFLWFIFCSWSLWIFDVLHCDVVITNSSGTSVDRFVIQQFLKKANITPKNVNFIFSTVRL